VTGLFQQYDTQTKADWKKQRTGVRICIVQGMENLQRGFVGNVSKPISPKVAAWLSSLLCLAERTGPSVQAGSSHLTVGLVDAMTKPTRKSLPIVKSKGG